MIFDDHDVHDDWNTSAAWVEEMRKTDWWDEHIVGGLMSYWIYQHIGNLSPDEQDEDELLRPAAARSTTAARSCASSRCGADREAGHRAGASTATSGDTRLVVIDSRCGRVLEEGKRSMLDEDEWQWVEDHATGGFDHLLLATSLPWLLAPGMHHLEAWNEAVCAGAWGGAGRQARREDPPGRRPRALGRVQRVLRAPGRAPARGGRRRARRSRRRRS